MMSLKRKGLASQLIPQHIFLFIGIIYGMLFLLTTPPFQVPDEPAHFLRSFQISEGRLLSEKFQDGIGGVLPESLVTLISVFDGFPLHVEKVQKRETIFSQIGIPLESRKRAFADFPTTALYSPVAYLPQAAGIATGKMFHFSPLLLMYTGRTFNLLLWVLLVYSAIRITPVHKWVFLLLALTPMSLYQSSSLSADGFTNGLSFLLIALFLRSALDEKEKIETSLLFLLGILSVMLSLAKAYFIIPALYLMIPPEKIGTKGRYGLIFALLLLLSAAAVMAWSFIIRDYYREMYRIYSPYIPSTLSPEKQMEFILSHPLSYCLTAARTLIENAKTYLDQFIGQLGWLDTSLPEALRIVYVITLMAIALADTQGNVAVRCKQKGIISGVLLASMVLTGTALYLTATPVGWRTIGGIQGRYFIPISPLFFLLFHNRKIRIDLETPSFVGAMISFILFSLTLTVFVIIRRYYVS